MDENLLLEVRDIVKTFPGVRALDRVRFGLRKGEVHALVGENGAGKSTLMHVLGGIYRPDSGEIRLNGKSLRFDNPYQAAQNGISVVFQELSLVQNLSVAENIFANRQPLKMMDLIDYDKLYQETHQVLKMFELQIDPRTLLKNLSVAEQQVVEILKAISHRPQVLILDEPTSSLTAVESRLLFKNIAELKQQGMSFIYISHHLGEIFEIADRVTVFRDGQYIDTCEVKDVTEAQIVKMMVGRELINMYGQRVSQIGAAYFRVRDGHGVDFTLKRGEILGLAGLVGAGRTELGRAIFGAEPLQRVEIFLNGKQLQVGSPKDAIKNRIGYLTENRKEQGLYLKMAIRNNCIAPSLRRFASRFGFMKEKAITDFAETSRSKFNIITPAISQQVRNLSGGNQQKVLLAMWIGTNPEMLIVDEPTRGVDVGAKSEIYNLLRQLAASGVGIIMISSDLPEILGVSDRVLVMRQGKMVGEFTREEATEENIITCATGVGQCN